MARRKTRTANSIVAAGPVIEVPAIRRRSARTVVKIGSIPRTGSRGRPRREPGQSPSPGLSPPVTYALSQLQLGAAMNSSWTLIGQLSQGGCPRSIRLQSMPFRVGRRTDLSLCLSRNSVSSLHAEFVIEGGALLLRDLQSTNGTYVNGERISGQVEIHAEDLIQFADMPFRVSQHSGDFDTRTVHEEISERALGLVQFDKLVTERALVSFFQPVVRLADREMIGYEILSRSRLVGLETPLAMFQAASQFNKEVELSRLMRIEGVRTSRALPRARRTSSSIHTPWNWKKTACWKR